MNKMCYKKRVQKKKRVAPTAPITMILAVKPTKDASDVLFQTGISIRQFQDYSSSIGMKKSR